MQKRGRFVLFVDPSLTALNAHQLWLPPAGAALLFAVARGADGSDKDALFVPGLHGVKHILVDPSGRQHVLLRANGAVLQLAIEGADIATRKVLLTFISDGIRDLGRVRDAYANLRRILSAQHPQANDAPRWTVRTRNLRDGFLTFDCHVAGAPDEREAAILLYGQDSAMSAWPTAPFRERMRRHRQRAQRLAGGGYRRFLE